MKTIVIIFSVLWVSMAFAEDNPCPPGTRYYPTIERCGEVQSASNETLDDKWRRETLEREESAAKRKREIELEKARRPIINIEQPQTIIYRDRY